MTKRGLPGSASGAPVEHGEQKNSAIPAAALEKEDDREYDHRGVLMPRRTRIGGIIMPQ
jgi:hypothetical protein